MPNFEQTSPHSPDDARRRLIAENLRYHEEKRLKLEDLRGVYGEDEVRKDAQLVLECDRRFERIGEGEEGKVLSEVRAGYLLNGEVLRPAQVKVGKKEIDQKVEEEAKKEEQRGDYV